MTDADFKKRLQDIGADLETATQRHVDKRNRRRRVITVAACGLVAVAVAAAVVTQVNPVDTESAAARTLNQAADSAPRLSKLKKGRYLYTRTLVVTRNNLQRDPAKETVVTRQITQLYAGADGAGVEVKLPLEERFIPPTPPPAPPSQESTGTGTTGTTGPTGASGPNAIASPPAAVVQAPGKVRQKPRKRKLKKGSVRPSELGPVEVALRDRLLAGYGLDAAQLARLSFDQQRFDRTLDGAAARVAKQLDPAASRPDIDRQAFSLVAAALGQWGEPMPASLRKALFEFAAGIDGIELASANTASGREAQKLTLGDASILLAPGSHRVLGTTYVFGDSETTIETLSAREVERLPANLR